ncbi:MAG: crossover junction endodeoxyribonuclease RuvC [Planctomycetota bacterium]|nr:crossover junction endodeoxyribonuclease RuvC [Planctomycetota bacterium]
MPESIRILGFDPGTRISGYGIIDAQAGGELSVVSYGAIRLQPPAGKIPIPQRLRHLYEALDEIVREHRPGVLAVEKIFHGRSFDSVMKVGEARGVGLLVGSLHDLEIEEYAATRIKKSVTGNGQASKSQVQAMMTRLLNLAEPPHPQDVTDALAIAFCYAQGLRRIDLSTS